jgi:hypothetical protein
MELFRNIRLKVGKVLLTKKLEKTKRKVRYSDFSVVKKIGIVWDASKSEEFSSLNRFYQKMQERKIEVKVIGYFDGKNLPDKYTAIRFLTCIKSNEINFFFQPDSSESDSFIRNNYDIIIDINFNKLIPLLYITSLSNAGFKVGLYDSDNINTPFDMMMELKSPVDLDNYLNQVIHYLEMIKSGTVKKVLN